MPGRDNRPPLISAVIPTYDRAPLIARAIESALDQSRPPDEIVVVDDGSRDGTAAAVAPYLDRVRYVRQDNAGSSAARNTGVAEALHPWIAFLDSDDVWRPDHLRLVDAAITATGGAARFYFGDTVGSSTEGGGASFWARAGLQIEPPHQLAPDAADWVMRAIQPTMLQAGVFRRDDYLAVGGLDPAIALRHDTLLFLRLGIGGAACAVAGAGAVMTDDDDPGARLSASVGDGTRRYWEETVAVYRTVLAGASGASPAHRAELRARLVAAHMRLARHARADHAPAEAARHVGRAVRTSPAALLSRAVGRAGRTLSGSRSAAPPQ